MFDFLPDQPAYQFPDLINVTYVMLWAFFLASVIAITHRLTHRGDQYPNQFFQALVLGSVVTAMVMLAIGDSLARGLGVFGAMAIIRFRTRIDDPRNVLFLFAALSSGLAVGVYGFTVSLVGTVIFCLGAVVLYYSPFRTFVHSHQLVIGGSQLLEKSKIDIILKDYTFESKLTGSGSDSEDGFRLEYSLSLKGQKDDLVRLLAAVDGVKQVRVRPLEFQING
ncbi:MAG: DUF4956 domain-containing protein [Cyclobacteriaceae bacterium]